MPVPMAVIIVWISLFCSTLIEARFLHVDELATNRQDGLVTPIAALLGRAAGGVTLDDVELGQCRIALGAIGQFARQTAAGQRAFANGFARLARGFASARGRQALCR